LPANWFRNLTGDVLFLVERIGIRVQMSVRYNSEENGTHQPVSLQMA